MLRKAGTSTDRANAALSSLQRTASALGMLRSRIEARIGSGPDAGGTPDLNRVLELVKNAQLMLKEMSARAESARFLEEFIRIISGASASVGEIQGEVKELVPMAEAALAEMHSAISDVSIALAPSNEEIDASIFGRALEETASPQYAAVTPEIKVNDKAPVEETPEESKEQLAEVAI